MKKTNSYMQLKRKHQDGISNSPFMSKEQFDLIERYHKERQKAIENDTTGDNYIYDMFNYELANHEYCITYDATDTIKALNLTMKEISNNKALLNGLNKAKQKHHEYMY